MTASTQALYRTIWRWHFYAGLFIAPFLFILAVSGAVYLFNDEINDALYPHQRFVSVPTQTVRYSELVDAALRDFPGGKVTRIDTPRTPDRSAEIFITPTQGEPVRVWVDPGTGKVLGHYIYANTLIGIADRTHGSLMIGNRLGDAIVELAACWGLILTVTGLYLWWPRKRGLRYFIWPDWRAAGRGFWKRLHGTVGLWTAALVLFLIITGLPWADFWGGLLQRGANLANIGYPTSFRGYATLTSETAKEVIGDAGPWTLNNAPMPQSGGQSGAHGGHLHDALTSTPSGRARIGIDRVREAVLREGMTDPYRLNYPKGETGVFAVFVYPDQPEGQRAIYIDQYSGRVLGDVSFADYGWLAKGVELGVQLHMDNYFGRANQVIMLIPCIGIVIMCATGPYMWWRRRPKGQLAAPRAISPLSLKTIALIVIGLGIVFPLVGASLVVVLIVDGLVRYAQTFRKLKAASN
jgi:uncharacterized iron-regulated membrane protein